ncbi:MAG: type I-E CRISPR-associated protein Cse1/CasA [Acidobacteriota bacterium]|nr:type I-E CRISPR-associated protein Cse1/CasA [Acidobacteriota bacterium]
MDGPVKPSFNLVSDPWVLVVMLDGSTEEVSLRDLFRRASEFRGIAGDIAQQSLTILRLCLAIMYRGYGRLPDGSDGLTESEMLDGWKSVWERGSFADGMVDGYLTEFEDQFDLFGESPFYQVTGLKYNSKDKEFDPITEMIADVPKRDKFLFTMRGRNAPSEIPFDEAARWLVYFQAYDCAGIKTPVVGSSHVNKGKVYPPKGIPATGWLGTIGGVYLEGDNLFQTLMLNWVMHDEEGREYFGVPGDVPAWEAPVTETDYRVVNPKGPAQLFSWQSRRVRLVLGEGGDAVAGVISCYGDIPHPTDMPEVETMTAWHKSPEKQKALGTPYVPWMPRAHDCSKAIWRGLEAILSRGEASEGDLRPVVIRWLARLREEGVDGLPREPSVHAQGMEYGVQSSVVTSSMDDLVSLGSALQCDSVAIARTVGVVSDADRAVYQLALLVRSVERSQGDKTKDKDPQGVRIANDVKEAAYLELDDLFRNRIAEFSKDEDADRYCGEWRDDVHRRLLAIADRYLEGASVSLFSRHGQDSISEARSKFHSQLNKILGPLQIGNR